ncbi:3-coathanger stack domain-containing protein [Emticicia sp. 17c]|uniref:3-coathanger stack domain-containing protein n=1 Tax=Emticicia sp. 17c TaxID=3127704 RepID=UPI00301D9A8C
MPRVKPAKAPSYLPNSFVSNQSKTLSFPPPLTSTMVSKEEIEPNNSLATANALGGNDVKIKGNIVFSSDAVDYFSFTASQNDRVYVATQTSFSATGFTTDSYLEILTNSESVIEADNDDGYFDATSSSIAGAIIPATGTYYIKVTHSSTGGQMLPYSLYFRLQSSAGTNLVAETEDNNTAPGQVIPASGWISGNVSSVNDYDFFSISLNAGDTVFLGLDNDPERDATTWNGQIGLGYFDNFILTANDPSNVSPNSESFFMTVKDAGTYSIFVGTGDNVSFGTYHLIISVLPANNTNFANYTSSDVPKTIPTTVSTTTSSLVVNDTKRIEKIRVVINLTHDRIEDLDIRLTSPAGNTVGLLTDISTNVGENLKTMNLKLDDDAGIPIGIYPSVNNFIFQPEYNYRLEWFKGQLSNGTWTLTIDDDTNNNGGTLISWGLEIQQQDDIAGTLTNIYFNDFESNNGGFTHTGSVDDWNRGTPTFAPINTSNSGVNCWKTNLTGSYSSKANSNLISPNISLANLETKKIYLTWAQKFQLEGAFADHAYVEVQDVSGVAPLVASKRVWQWAGATMRDVFGTSTIEESAGWGIYRADISEFAGKTIRITFHIDSDDGANPAGWAIDDVRVFKTFCSDTETITSNYNGVFSRVVASNGISATNTIQDDFIPKNTNIMYQSEKSIMLLPNFKADAGTVFTAQIGGCN